MIFVIQGSFAVSDKADEVIQTLLGSCVATCLYDPVARVGGMNHFLLPGEERTEVNSMSYGAHSMEVLINALMRLGARRDTMQAKIFGGARMMTSGRDIGQNNGIFARSFLQRERIQLVSESIGGDQARKIRMVPTTGNVQQMFVGTAASVPAPPPSKAAARPAPASSGDLELF